MPGLAPCAGPRRGASEVATVSQYGVPPTLRRYGCPSAAPLTSQARQRQKEPTWLVAATVPMSDPLRDDCQLRPTVRVTSPDEVPYLSLTRVE